jgi:hypothetical protein
LFAQTLSGFLELDLLEPAQFRGLFDEVVSIDGDEHNSLPSLGTQLVADHQ